VERPAEADNVSADPSILEVHLRAAPHTHSIEGRVIEGYAYNEQTPGPTLRANVGDTLRVHLQNDLDVETTIHWHGVDAPYDMDGVSWDKEPVASGASFTYEVPLTRAGTFWYHPHFDTERQVDLGLYGVLVVEDPAEPSVSTGDVERELVLVFDGWEEATDHSHPEGTDGHTHAYDLPTWTVNGQRRPTYTLPGGSRIRARLVNSSNTGYLSLRWPDMRVIALDQGLLTGPQSPETLVMAPGDRAEVIFLIGTEGFPVTSDLYTLRGGPTSLDPIDLFDIAVSAPSPAPEPIDWPWREMTPSPLPTHADVVYVFSGSNHTDEWLINGESFPDVTIEAFPRGSRPVVEIRNLSPTEHPFHMHG
ncbi:MAG: multicopper oxidase family protein, partial [Myxococcota bacterium]|nr:multicopper oxidase family protein [Myxococcota bacterium]